MKKGFTLIEIVAVIAVVSILLVILTPYLLNSVNNKKNEVSNVAKKMIYDAADIYIKDNNEIYTSDEGATYCIKLETLVNSGKLMNPIKDMKKNKEVPLNYYVKATANSYNQFDYELVDNKSCDEKLPISISYKMDSQYEKIKKVTITYPEGNYIKKYKIISGETEENIELNKEITVTDSEISLNFKNNGKLEAILLNGTTNDEIIRKTINITKVDNTSPKVTSSKIDKLGKIVYTISDSESGLKDYCINNTNSTDDCEWVKINNYPLIYTFTYTASKVNNYYIHIRDKFDNTFISQTPVKITNSNLCQYDVKKTWTFNYTGSEQSFTVPCTGNYKMETWGAQGGSYDNSYHGGYGGYSTGNISLKENQKLYVNVGGQGIELQGGYNGGGTVTDGNLGRAGGGATHIATSTGLLKNFEKNLSNLIIVSGAGGGAAKRGEGYGDGNGGSAGGYLGSNGESVNHTNGFGYGYGTGGSQTTGGHIVWTAGTYNISSTQLTYSYGLFGIGRGTNDGAAYATGGGAGFYGGGGAFHGGAGGGSGYIGNSLLSNKAMYCYNCATSNDSSTKTISTTNVSSTATANYAKKGNGYAKITYLGD